MPGFSLNGNLNSMPPGRSFFRRDAVIGRWTIINPAVSLASRAGAEPGSYRLEPGGFCPFCPGHESKTPPAVLTIGSGGEIDRPDAGGRSPRDWRVRVVPNKFPALGREGIPQLTTSGIYDRMGGFGVHDIIVESPEHAGAFAGYSANHAESVVKAWANRYEDIARDPRVRYVLLFRNRGGEAGASLAHPHSQIIGLPVVPKLVIEEIEGARRYYEWKERCVFCDIISDEVDQGARIVSESPEFLAIAPYASRFAYEIWILPRRHRAHFSGVVGLERELGALLRDVLGRLDHLLDSPPYNFIIHSAPCHESELTHYHWHIEIMPRLTRIAGFEWGTGFYVNPIPPEEAAAALKRAE